MYLMTSEASNERGFSFYRDGYYHCVQSPGLVPDSEGCQLHSTNKGPPVLNFLILRTVPGAAVRWHHLVSSNQRAVSSVLFDLARAD